MNEETLIHQAQEGDIVAFNRLVVQHQELVFNVAYRIMGDPAVAKDVAQETFITAYQSLKSFRGGSFKSWDARVATNRCYDKCAAANAGRRPRWTRSWMNESFAFLRSPDEGPEAHRQRVELALVIEHCLKGLPDDQRIVTVLGDVEGYDYQEIANIARIIGNRKITPESGAGQAARLFAAIRRGTIAVRISSGYKRKLGGLSCLIFCGIADRRPRKNVWRRWAPIWMMPSRPPSASIWKGYWPPTRACVRSWSGCACSRCSCGRCRGGVCRAASRLIRHSMPEPKRQPLIRCYPVLRGATALTAFFLIFTLALGMFRGQFAGGVAGSAPQAATAGVVEEEVAAFSVAERPPVATVVTNEEARVMATPAPEMEAAPANLAAPAAVTEVESAELSAGGRTATVKNSSAQAEIAGDGSGGCDGT